MSPTGSPSDVVRTAVEQFTVHATSFATSPIMNDGSALDTLLELCGLRGGEAILDVACGPAIVSCRLAAAGATLEAPVRVVGVDITPAMVELAVERAAQAGVSANTAFQVAPMEALPFPDGSFDVVVSRYALHHAAAPAVAVAEMVRVLAPGGCVVVVDFAASDDPAAAAAYDDAERYRDPSHQRNLTVSELRSVFREAGLRIDAERTYRLPADLDTVLSRSHGTDHARVRAAFEDSLDGHRMGVDARRDGARIAFDYPLAGFRLVR